ncbi:DUF4954 family protein [Prolixibacter sp. NT017]|uniref:DUF4954 family protein n=1 Tax=Prolixibacter sp. NT017 TaxID=2652390 RepID=UPI0012789B96|nr:DUF4954 family protein [Prolixibacter sp. NT017]GET24339.1 DUF4954 domain-containing protein [Prolixibacter sp. NT017]
MAHTNRKLTSEEIEKLEQRHCTAEDWNQITVPHDFDIRNLRNVHFYGTNVLGRFDKKIKFFNGIEKPTGIYDASLHNCTIGDNVLIRGVQHLIANYDIEEDVVIKNTDQVVVTESSTFGNGTMVAVLDESGGRSIPIYNHLSAHLAYMMTLYRHRRDLQEKLFTWVEQYAESRRAERGFIGKGTRILNCHSIINVYFGPYTLAEGVHRLENATLNSKMESPVVLGAGVIGRNFIVSSGSEISDGAIVENCFIGQGCQLSKQYSAENSLFFANCQGFHGEACSIFAGPYTVTHHKSTLLIAGMFSFLNAGSGSNQSNHMYKLGPIHHGIVQRGSKTASDSYLLWPAKIGPFTLVMGRHYKNSDTSDLPFSYLIENKDESYLMPGINLRSVGTIRDAIKWPRRDRRTDPDTLDFINFNLLSPFTIQKMLRGQQVLEDLQNISGKISQTYSYSSTIIKNSSLQKGWQLYNMGITKFLGNSVITRLKDSGIKTEEEMRQRLTPSTKIGEGEWIDLGGLIAPKKEVSSLMNKIEAGEITELTEAREWFARLHSNYYEYEWTWASHLLEERLEKSISEMTISDIKEMVERWKESVVSLDRMLYDDARKEFTLKSQTGFGSDGNEETRSQDFEVVRGTFENNQFVREILDHIERKSRLADVILEQLNQLQ